MIIKIQRPLYFSADDGDAMAYVYNQDRSVRLFLRLSDVAGLFKDDELKVYHKAKLTDSAAGFKPLDSEQTNMAISLQNGTVNEERMTESHILIGKRVNGQSW